MWEIAFGTFVIAYFGVLIIWGVFQVNRISEPMRFRVRHLLIAMTVLAAFLGAIAAAVH